MKSKGRRHRQEGFERRCQRKSLVRSKYISEQLSTYLRFVAYDDIMTGISQYLFGTSRWIIIIL